MALMNGLFYEIYDAVGKSTVVADCLEVQFRSNDYEDEFHDH
jgi:hypothetical protein